MRLRFRLSLTFTAVTAAVLLTSFAVVYEGVRRDETRDLDQALRVQAVTAARLALAQDPTHPSISDGTGEEPEIPVLLTRYAAIYDRGGRALAHTKSFGPAPPARPPVGPNVDALPPEGRAFDLTVGNERLRAVLIPISPLARGAPPGMTLLFAVSRSGVDKDLSFLWRVFSGLFFSAVLVTWLVARWLAGRLSRDVDAIAMTARRVSTGDLGARVGTAARGSTETRDLGRDLDEMIVQLDRLMTAQRTFVSHAAHELRSPLATLRGQLQLALRRPRRVEEYRETIEEVLAEVEQLAALAEDLLTLARVERRSGLSDTTTVADAVGDAMRMARGPAELRGVRLIGPELEGRGSMRGARADVARALRNLIDNAVNHSPPQGEVRLQVDLSPDRVQIAVEDQGDGVALEDVPHIFSPFFRGAREQSGDAPGAGLGLAIAREIARAYGGDVRLEPSQGPGARFVFEMPTAPAAGGA